MKKGDLVFTIDFCDRRFLYIFRMVEIRPNYNISCWIFKKDLSMKSISSNHYSLIGSNGDSQEKKKMENFKNFSK